ncbi:hypothetical protein HDU82_000130, partial [Entophlyctis luteolus]
MSLSHRLDRATASRVVRTSAAQAARIAYAASPALALAPAPASASTSTSTSDHADAALDFFADLDCDTSLHPSLRASLHAALLLTLPESHRSPSSVLSVHHHSGPPLPAHLHAQQD